MSDLTISVAEISIESIPMSTMLYRYTNDDFVLVDCNAMAVHTNNISRERAIGASLSQLFPEARKCGFFDLLLQVYRSGISKEIDMKCCHGEGGKQWRKHCMSKLHHGDIIVFYSDIDQPIHLSNETLRQQQQLEVAEKIAHLGSWEWNMQNNTIVWSDEVFRIFGEEPQSFIPTYERFISYLSVEDQSALEEAIGKAVEHKEGYLFEHQVARRDGSIRYVQESGQVLFDNDEQALSLVGTILDVTQKREGELSRAEFYRKEKIYRNALLEWANVDYQNAQEAIEKATKISAEALNVERVSIWLYTEDRTALECMSMYCLSDEEHRRVEPLQSVQYPHYFRALEEGRALIIDDAQQSAITSELTQSYLKPMNIQSMLDTPIIYRGQVEGVVCNEHVGSLKKWTSKDVDFAMVIANNVSLALEIQKRQRVENQLQSLGNIIDNSNNEVYIFNADNLHFTYINKEAQHNIGYSFEEILEMTPVAIKPEHTMQSFLVLLQALKKGSQEYVVFETIHQRKDGSTYNVEIRLQLMTVDATEQFVVIAYDISERKRVELQLKESEEKFRTIAENSLMGVFIYLEKCVYVNQAFMKMTGYTQEELYNMEPWDLVAPLHRTEVKEAVLRRLKGERFPQGYNDMQFVTKHGQLKTMRVSTQTIRYRNRYAGMGTTIDVTDIKETKQQLNLLARAVEQMDELVRITDKDGIITYVNDALVAHSGYRRVELIGKKISIFKSGTQDEHFYEELWNTILSAKTYRGVFVNKKKDGQLYYEEETITPILGKDNTIENFVVTSQDITERVRMEESLQKLATTDSLTGVYNRHKSNEELRVEIARAKRYHSSFALVMIDIDHFKVVNDTYGHDIGDYVLQEFSSIISNLIRESDRFGRWGGEEFLIILPEVEEEQIMPFAHKLKEAVATHIFKDIDPITISVGVSIFHENDTKKSLLKRVDQALYQAKKEGRNRVVFE